MADIYRIYVAHSVDGKSFSAQQEIHPGAAGANDYRYSQTMHQEVNGVYYDDRKMFLIWTQDGGLVQCAFADLPPVPFVPKINKLNRKRTFGDEL